MESNVAATPDLNPDSESDLDLVYRVTETAMSALEDSVFLIRPAWRRTLPL